MDPMGLNETDIFLVLKPARQWTDGRQGSAHRADPPGARRHSRASHYGFTQPIEMRVSEMLTGVRGDVAVKLFGSDLEVLNQKAEEIARPCARCRAARMFSPAATRACSTWSCQSTGWRPAASAWMPRRCNGFCAPSSKAFPSASCRRACGARRCSCAAAAGVRESPEAFADLPIVLADGSHVPAVRRGRRAPCRGCGRRGSRARPTVHGRTHQCRRPRPGGVRGRGPGRGGSSRWRCRPATTWNGAASSRISSVPRRGSVSWCRSPWD